MHHLRSVRSYSLLESPVIICIQPISHPMSGVMVISAKKTQNQARQDSFAQSYHGRWFFFHNLELEQAFFYAKNLLSRITTYLSHIIAKKNFIIFFFSNAGKYPLLTSRSILLLAIFILLFAMSEKQKSTINESLKFISSIYRILKSQKTISLAEV